MNDDGFSSDSGNSIVRDNDNSTNGNSNDYNSGNGDGLEGGRKR